jgi:hypothetical protein
VAASIQHEENSVLKPALLPGTTRNTSPHIIIFCQSREIGQVKIKVQANIIDNGQMKNSAAFAVFSSVLKSGAKRENN